MSRWRQTSQMDRVSTVLRQATFTGQCGRTWRLEGQPQRTGRSPEVTSRESGQAVSEEVEFHFKCVGSHQRLPPPSGSNETARTISIDCAGVVSHGECGRVEEDVWPVKGHYCINPEAGTHDYVL